MKQKLRIILCLLTVALTAVNTSLAQSDILTNSTILKMVKAKLADELIIDEIKNASVSFSLNADSLIVLQQGNVSNKVIQAMKNASPDQVSGEITAAAPAPKIQSSPEKIIEKAQQPDPPLQPIASESKSDSGSNATAIPAGSGITSEAVGYVIPLEDLMDFWSGEFSSFTKSIESWDAQVKSSVVEWNNKKENIRKAEKELFDKKNSGSGRFTDEINKLKENLNEHRESYMDFENDMVTDGLKMIKEMEGVSKQLNRSVNSKFSEVSQAVKKSDADLSLTGTPERVVIPELKINESISIYVAPVTEILYFCRNEISFLQNTIRNWNEKVNSDQQADLKIQNRLDPLLSELNKLQADQKTNRKLISEVKDQCSDLEKERKRLRQKIEKDGSELAKYLDDRCKEVQSSLEERFADIVENIRYLYQDSFTYRSI